MGFRLVDFLWRYLRTSSPSRSPLVLCSLSQQAFGFDFCSSGSRRKLLNAFQQEQKYFDNYRENLQLEKIQTFTSEHPQSVAILLF